ncbi:MAG: histidine kinase dimerization/phosphoacceptor domain -containing protein [Pseudomonadota bacterium]
MQDLCIEYLKSAGDAERYEILGRFLANPNGNRARFIKAVDLNPLLSEMSERTLVRANAYRGKESGNPAMGIGVEDLDQYIADAERLNDDKALASLYYSAVVKRANTDPDFPTMTDYLTKGLDIIRKNNFGEASEYIYLVGLGNVALDSGQLVEAVNYYVETAQLTKDPLARKSIVANANIGRVFMKLGAYERALEYLDKSKDSLVTLGDAVQPTYIASVLALRGKCLYALEKFDAADAELIWAERVIQENSNTPFGRRIEVFRQKILRTHAKTAYALGNVDQAVRLAKETAAIEGAQQSEFVKAETLSWLAGIFLEQGNREQALEFAANAEAVLVTRERPFETLKDSEEDYQLVFEFARNMAHVLAATGQADPAMRYMDLTAELAETLIKQENMSAVSNARALLEIREGEKQVEMLKNENALKVAALKESRRAQWLAFSLAGLAALIAFLAYRFYRAQRSLADLRAIYVRDTHHRAKNHLQIITSLLNMSVRRNRKAGVDAENLREIREQTRAMAMLHDHMLALMPEDSAFIRADEHFRTLATTLASTYHAEDRLDVSGIETLPIDINIATPLSLIMTEIASNSFKHNPMASISVKLFRENNGRAAEAVLEMRDNGKGFDLDDTPSQEGGLSLVHDLAKQIRGKLKLRSDQKGTIWQLKFPLSHGAGAPA